ncbi:MAG TPA: enoyl-CoA hydratase/isomerase family protein [Parvibaculum sp.]|uniref:enoyl-CoA hydratase/isomerase family protein n=1 Tax=Parvibaculum sp. TaxID=2024848 RepID=UPI002BEB6D51|nr:enoyl-CoA hydratase/isomerase family protein [Parvibaculum sp.]HMM15663.1 enoyl-CoA hydratase/isomerase family protein [Parvibaculum sp.]
MPGYNNVTIEKQGPVALVRFDRKGNRNAFNQETILELTDVARRFQDDLETQAVVLTGTREAFSGGIDLKERATRAVTAGSDLELRQTYYRGVRLCQAWEDMPQVTIAAIEGMAVGAGVALPIALDWRVMGKGAFLYVPEVKIGINLQWGALPRLITLVGPARAKRICILCERMGADHALDWGLVDEVAEDGQVVEKALEMARAASSMPAPAVRMVKEAVNATANALHKATSYADADQSQLSTNFRSAQAESDKFVKGRS